MLGKARLLHIPSRNYLPYRSTIGNFEAHYDALLAKDLTRNSDSD